MKFSNPPHWIALAIAMIVALSAWTTPQTAFGQEITPPMDVATTSEQPSSVGLERVDDIKRAERRLRIGKALLIPGAVVGGLGAGMTLLGMGLRSESGDFGYQFSGSLYQSTGSVLFVGALPFWISGAVMVARNKRKLRALERNGFAHQAPKIGSGSL
ncbi:MAG: hypothetical protein R3A47_05615 [Polyangiales bacterium]